MAWTCSALTNDALVAALQSKGLVTSPAVAAAMRAVDRRWFIPAGVPPEDVYRDWPYPIGFNVTISAPHMHAIMLEILAPYLAGGAGATSAGARELRVLDVGSGSGYLTAVIAEMCRAEAARAALEWSVTGIEHMAGLRASSLAAITEHMRPLVESGRLNIVQGDGRNPGAALPASENYYDLVHVGAAAVEGDVPTLARLLRAGGCLVVPVGEEGCTQRLMVYTRDTQGRVSGSEHSLCNFVPLTSAAHQTAQR